MSNKSFYLSFTEFYLLASKAGIDSFFGFTDNPSLNPSNNDIVISLNRLVRNRMVAVESDSLKVKDELKKLFESIAASGICAVIYNPGPVYKIMCCYISAQTIVTEISEDGGKIKLGCLDNNEIIDYLQSEGLISYESATDPEQLFEQSETIAFLKKNGYGTDVAVLRSMDNIGGVIDFIDCRKNGKICRCCFVDDTVPESMVVISESDAGIFFGTDNIIKEITDLWRNCHDNDKYQRSDSG